MTSLIPPALAIHLWQSTLFGVGIWILSFMLRHNRAAFRHRLWLAASLKFMVPFSLLTGFGSWVASLIPPAPLAPSMIPVTETVGRLFTGRDLLDLARSGAGPAAYDWRALIAAVWLCGCAVGLGRWAMNWMRVRRMARRGRPEALAISIPAVSCADRVEPGVFGIFKPVLIVPDGITDRLSKDELRAVLDHEECHVRRRDNLTIALHSGVEALFWFHPLVWLIRGRLMTEQERACDEAVLASGANPQIYGNSILKICHHYVATPLCVSGITGFSLKRRIRNIMSQTTGLRLSKARIMLLVAAVIVALAIPFAMGIIGPRGEAQRELTAGEAWRRARRPPSSTIPVGPPFTATVTANIAQFVFPLPQQAEWEWHGPNAPASGLEYVWTVGVENEGRTSGFGSFLFNSGGPAARGSIDQLLDASQWTIFESDPKTNSYKVVRLGDGYNFRQVDVSVEGGNLIVRVEREDAYRYLFSGKPTHATFGIRKPNAKGEFEQTDQKVPIVYTEG